MTDKEEWPTFHASRQRMPTSALVAAIGQGMVSPEWGRLGFAAFSRSAENAHVH